MKLLTDVRGTAKFLNLLLETCLTQRCVHDPFHESACIASRPPVGANTATATPESPGCPCADVNKHTSKSQGDGHVNDVNKHTSKGQSDGHVTDVNKHTSKSQGDGHVTNVNKHTSKSQGDGHVSDVNKHTSKSQGGGHVTDINKHIEKPR